MKEHLKKFKENMEEHIFSYTLSWSISGFFFLLNKVSEETSECILK